MLNHGGWCVFVCGGQSEGEIMALSVCVDSESSERMHSSIDYAQCHNCAHWRSGGETKHVRHTFVHIFINKSLSR